MGSYGGGDYISDAAAAIVGGLGMAPGANIGDAAAIVGGLGMAPGANIGDAAAIFEATHGTAPKHAGLDRINPGSLILSGQMMLEFLGWHEAAALINHGVSQAIANRCVTYDLARMMEPPVDPPLKCSEFADAIIHYFPKH